MVCVGWAPDDGRISRISYDVAGGVEDTVSILWELGRRRVALILKGNGGHLDAEARRGYEAGLKAVGAGPAEAGLIVEQRHQHETGVVSRILRDSKADVFIVRTPALAVRTWNALQRLGVKVPEQVDVISIGDSDALWRHPRIAAISETDHRIDGSAVVDLLKELSDSDGPALSGCNVTCHAALQRRETMRGSVKQ